MPRNLSRWHCDRCRTLLQYTKTHRPVETKKWSICVASVTYVNGIRLGDKKLPCFLCKTSVMWLARHLEWNHADNFLVALNLWQRKELNKKTDSKFSKEQVSLIIAGAFTAMGEIRRIKGGRPISMYHWTLPRTGNLPAAADPNVKDGSCAAVAKTVYLKSS